MRRYERLSAYRFHGQDPLVFNDGGKLLWWVGQCKPFAEDGANANATAAGTGTTKCGNPYPDRPAGNVGKAGGEVGGEAGGEGGAADETNPIKLGRKLTAINVTTYGWYYSF